MIKAIVVAILAVILGIIVTQHASAEVGNSFWNKLGSGSNIWTNVVGSPSGQATIHVGGCIIEPGGTPCAGGGGTVTSVTGTDPITVNNAIPAAPVIGLSLVTDTSLVGNGSTSNPLSVVGLSQSLQGVLAVKAATISGLPNSPGYNNGASGVGATITGGVNGALGTINGVTVGVGDRILVKNQTSPAIQAIQNGIYIVTNAGSISTKYILTRTTDSDATSEFMNQLVTAQFGTATQRAPVIWGQNTISVTPGTSQVVYTATQFFVTQAPAGTQVNGAVPTWNGTAQQLIKGGADFFHDINQLTIQGNNFGIYKEYNYSNNNLGDLGNGAGIYAGDSLGPVSATNGAKGQWELDALGNWSNLQRAFSATYETQQYLNGTGGTVTSYAKNTSTNSKGSLELTAGTATLKGDITAVGISEVAVSANNVVVTNEVANNAAIKSYTPSSGQQKTALNLPVGTTPTSTVTVNGSEATSATWIKAATYAFDSTDPEVPDNTLYLDTLGQASNISVTGIPAANTMKGREFTAINGNSFAGTIYSGILNFTASDYQGTLATDTITDNPYESVTYKSMSNGTLTSDWGWYRKSASEQPRSGIQSSMYKIASLTGVDLATLATTTIPFTTGFTAANTYPNFRVIRYNTGTVGIALVSVALNGDAIDGGSGLSGLAAGKYNYRPVDSNITLGTTGNYAITVGTANLTPATADVEIWGVKSN